MIYYPAAEIVNLSKELQFLDNICLEHLLRGDTMSTLSLREHRIIHRAAVRAMEAEAKKMIESRKKKIRYRLTKI